jgi:WD40 repeat protein
MPQPPQFPQLAFAAAGAVLLHSTDSAVTAWDFATWQRRYTCVGRLIGVSQSRTTFATERAPNAWALWESATGRLQAPSPTVLADLPLDVRYRISMDAQERGHYTGQWIDITGQQPPRSFKVQTRSPLRLERLENWIVVAPQGWVAGSWFWAEDDFAGAYGLYHAALGPLPPPVSLTVSRFHTVPPLYFSREHDWLVTGEQNAFNVYTASTGQPHGARAGRFHVLDGGGDVVAFHPRERFWFAVNRDPVLFKNADLQGYLLLDINTPNDRAAELRAFPETRPVIALAFHPSGEWIADLLKDGAIHVWNVATGERVAQVNSKQ